MDGQSTHGALNKIIEMAKDDQELRKYATELHLPDGRLDAENTKSLSGIIEQHGWPTITEFGEEAAHAAWLIAQHSPDIEFMKRCLSLMNELPEHEVNQADVAYLTDRVLILQGMPQIYGTQYHYVGVTLCPFPLADPERVDELRGKVGLDELSVNTQLMIERYGDKD